MDFQSAMDTFVEAWMAANTKTDQVQVHDIVECILIVINNTMGSGIVCLFCPSSHPRRVNDFSTVLTFMYICEWHRRGTTPNITQPICYPTNFTPLEHFQLIAELIPRYQFATFRCIVECSKSSIVSQSSGRTKSYYYCWESYLINYEYRRGMLVILFDF